MIPVKNAGFIMLIITLFIYLCVIEFIKINEFLRKFLVQNKKTPTKQMEINQTLRQYRYRHTANTHFIMHINSVLISKFYFSYFICNLFFNAYAIVFLSFKSVNGNVIIFLLFIQTIPLTSILPMIWLNRLMNNSMHLGSILAQIGKYHQNLFHFREHWKAMTYYELLHNEHKRFALSASILSSFTSKALVDVRYRFTNVI